MKLKSNKKWLIYSLYLIIYLFASYVLTTYLGVQRVKSKHERERKLLKQELYKKFKQIYKNDSLESLTKKWKNHQKKQERYTRTTDYYVLFPLVIKSIHNDVVVGHEEYHLWYIFGVWTFQKKRTWIT